MASLQPVRESVLYHTHESVIQQSYEPISLNALYKTLHPACFAVILSLIGAVLTYAAVVNVNSPEMKFAPMTIVIIIFHILGWCEVHWWTWAKSAFVTCRMNWYRRYNGVNAPLTNNDLTTYPYFLQELTPVIKTHLIGASTQLISATLAAIVLPTLRNTYKNDSSVGLAWATLTALLVFGVRINEYCCKISDLVSQERALSSLSQHTSQSITLNNSTISPISIIHVNIPDTNSN